VRIPYSRFEFPLDESENITFFNTIDRSCVHFTSCIRRDEFNISIGKYNKIAIILTYDAVSHTYMKLKLCDRKNLDISILYEIQTTQ